LINVSVLVLSLQAKTTIAPFSNKSKAVSYPIPAELHVTTTILSVKFFLNGVFFP